ncbi:hypothetical protein J4E93_002987 [Alternaria ventricosa]|uniref:uncharacterized protein n=1 Tax=Alternaria ventricosa TaxID=1187951 RepID=UPI0020C33B90|nr:uncharacterized protein J4E93_002987 [Alternaria ventricosa]KAI4650630.1 hypothetical protein J4E93_002987 [Alternaria ventricosa]
MTCDMESQDQSSMYISDREDEYSRQPDSASQQPRAVEPPTPIFFYDAQDVYGQLSNMYPSSFKNSIFTYGPPKYREYCCVEQFFQHAKALWAMDTGSSSNVSYKVMLKAVGLKFTVSESSDALRAVLLATSDREIVEASRDMTWGCGLTLEEARKHKGSWPGKNLLGKALMEIRQEIVDEKGRQTRGFAPPNDAVAGGELYLFASLWFTIMSLHETSMLLTLVPKASSLLRQISEN